jgi:hypothetical protein
VSRQDIAERFARETAEHQMQILHDDGLYRQIRFRHPDHGSYWFDLITVPHALIFRGDGESYVFDRLADMFEFFRSGVWADGTLHIDPHYWAEKLTSDRDCVMKYDQDLFEQQVKEHVAEAIRDRTAPRGIGAAVRYLLEYGDITWEDGARRELEAFEYTTKAKAVCQCGDHAEFFDDTSADLWSKRHVVERSTYHRVTVTPVETFTFEDTWEWSFKDYDWWFLWACHAIVWGIAKYDRAKAAARQAVAANA